MSRRGSLAIVVAALLGVLLGGCGSAADDLARYVRVPPAELKALLGAEARSAGSTGDDLAASWLPAVRAARDRYTAVPPEVRSVACSAASDWLTSRFDEDPATEFDAPESVLGAIGDLNATVGGKAMADDLTVAVAKARAGDYTTLELLTLTSAMCSVAD